MRWKSIIVSDIFNGVIYAINGRLSAETYTAIMRDVADILVQTLKMRNKSQAYPVMNDTVSESCCEYFPEFREPDQEAR